MSLAHNIAGWGDDWIMCLECGGEDPDCFECGGEGGWPADATYDEGE